VPLAARRCRRSEGARARHQARGRCTPRDAARGYGCARARPQAPPAAPWHPRAGYCL